MRETIKPLVLLLALTTVLAQSAPYRPANDATVLEQLPLRPTDPLTRELASLRAALRQDSANLQVATRLARRYYELVAQEGDPRFLGYAEAALRPWWNLPDPPDEIRVLRASLAQFTHDFAGAVRDLDIVLTRNPANGEARALRATIHIVQARYDAAKSDCDAMKGVLPDLIQTGCEAMVDGLTGKASIAYERLLAALNAQPESPNLEKLWVLLRLAEMSQRLQRMPVAEQHFRQALSLKIEDTFLLAAYADLLLELKRPAEVVALLKRRTASDGLLMRLALAERSLVLPEAENRAATLMARYAAARLRGDTVHEQEEARFMLATGQSAQQALALAVDNWRLQREPRDARVLLTAAIAARSPAAAKPVLEWMKQSAIEDAALAALAQQLQERR